MFGGLGEESMKVPEFYTARGQVSGGRLGWELACYSVCRRFRVLQITKNVGEEEMMGVKSAPGHPSYQG